MRGLHPYTKKRGSPDRYKGAEHTGSGRAGTWGGQRAAGGCVCRCLDFQGAARTKHAAQRCCPRGKWFSSLSNGGSEVEAPLEQLRAEVRKELGELGVGCCARGCQVGPPTRLGGSEWQCGEAHGGLRAAN